jgi:hypothetical protein
MVDVQEKKSCKEHFVSDGFSLEWGERGLLIRAIDYHATGLLVDWQKLLNMAEYLIGDSLRIMIGQNPVIAVDATSLSSDEVSELERESLPEMEIIRALADETCSRITRKTIAQLQRMRDALHSRQDSGLRDAWDEICVQLQDGLSIFWDACDLTVRSYLAGNVSNLRVFEREAVWMKTPEGDSWDCDVEEDREPCPVNDDEIIDYLAQDYVYRAACNWSNPRIRAFLDRGCLDRFLRDIESQRS